MASLTHNSFDVLRTAKINALQKTASIGTKKFRPLKIMDRLPFRRPTF